MAMTHNPYVILPEGPATKGLRKRQRPVPAIAHSPLSRTLAVVREVAAAGPGFLAVPRLGWTVLQRLWRVSPTDFDAFSLAHLRAQPQALQQHVLLVLATTSVGAVQNLSAFISCLIREAGKATQVCLGFVAGCCQGDLGGCPFAHPAIVPAWAALADRWQVSWLDFDYLVLNSLLLRPEPLQEEVLRVLARMKLKSVRNPSALLASIVRQCCTAEPGCPLPKAQPRPGSPHPPSPPPPSPPASPPGLLSAVPRTAPPPAVEVDGPRPTPPCPPPPLAVAARAAEVVGKSGADCPPVAGAGPPAPLNWADQLDLEDALAQEPPAQPSPQPGSPPPPARLAPAPPRPGPGEAVPEATPPPSPPALPATPLAASLGESRTAWVVRLLRERAATLAPPTVAWLALQCRWGLGPAHFDPVVLGVLGARPLPEQEHVLLSLAAMDLTAPHDLNALLRAALATAHRPVCWRYLAGLCPTATGCQFCHPAFAPAWAEAGRRGVSYLAVDYAVLNVLLPLPIPVQERVLDKLCRQPSPGTGNPSEWLRRALMESFI